jgi:nucleolar protein 6
MADENAQLSGDPTVEVGSTTNDGKKLTKKQLKASDFRRKVKGLEPLERPKKLEKPEKAKKQKRKGEEIDDKKSKKRKSEEEQREDEATDGVVTKSSKRRKRSKAEGPKEHQKRLIVFVGNIPYDSTQEELQEHLKAAHPSGIRLRKGFAFVEFEGSDAAKNLNVALRLHHTMFRNRRINVELTAGGGGNNENRRKRLQEKRERLLEEHRERIAKEEKKKPEATAGESSIHPSRQALIKH